MSAVDVIKDLIKLGTIASDAAEKNKKDGQFDYVAFFTGTAPTELAGAVTALLNALQPNELKSAVATIEQKQSDLLAGRQLYELGTDELVQYSALTDAKLLLRTAALKRSVEGNIFTWLVDDGGLASIIKIAKLVLPLVV